MAHKNTPAVEKKLGALKKLIKGPVFPLDVKKGSFGPVRSALPQFN